MPITIHGGLLSFEIVEVNPVIDEHNRTTNLAVEMSAFGKNPVDKASVRLGAAAMSPRWEKPSSFAVQSNGIRRAPLQKATA